MLRFIGTVLYQILLLMPLACEHWIYIDEQMLSIEGAALNMLPTFLDAFALT